ncbi:MAG TPA: amidohydrolase family protein [Candidatus Angelobacter sp.]|nr:amidohydrolase family protein [Candidatus Angelobacter sp.]
MWSSPPRVSGKRQWLAKAIAVILLAGWQGFAGVPMARAQASGAFPPDIAIVNVTVIAMERDGAVSGQTVLVRQGKIAAIAPASSLHLDPATLIVDGTGKFVIPGLADMHAHLQRESELKSNNWFIHLLLANGVTTIRNMWGIPEHLALRHAIETGEMIGPTIYTAGPILDGRPPMWQGSVIIDRADQADTVVKEQQAAGYDFVKVYSRLSADSYQAIVAAATIHHMKVAGHVPLAVGLANAIRAGQYSIEHLDGYITAIQSDDSPVFGKDDWYSQMVAYSHVDQQKLVHMAKLTQESDVWNCPTLVTMSKWLPPAAREKLLKQPGMQFVPADVRKTWELMSDRQLRPFSTLDMLKLRRAEDSRSAMVKVLFDAGAKLVAGTDTPAPFVIPGISLHEELGKLTAAGLTPYQALQTATRNGAELLGRLEDFGTISVGKRADLVLLDADPLTAISNAAAIRGVMLRGRWFSRAELESMLANDARQDLSPAPPPEENKNH